MALAEEPITPPESTSNPDAPASPPTEATGDSLWQWLARPNHLDAWHGMVSRTLTNTVDSIDHFFGDERLEDDNKGTRLRLRTGVEYSRYDDFSLTASVRVRLDMPQLERRLQLIVDDDIEAEQPGEAGNISDAVSDSEPVTALRLLLRDDDKRRVNFDVGLRAGDPVQGYTRLRGRVTVPFERWELRLTQSGSWLSDDGFTTLSEMLWTRPMGNRWWVRSRSQVIWEEEEPGVKPRQTFTLGRIVDDRRAWRVDLSGEWPETPHTHTATYTVQFTWRRPLYKRWLFLEISPWVDFQQEHDFRTNPGIALRVETIFGDER
jgi:hypothetical protein